MTLDPVCFSCVYLVQGSTCLAFPNGIPDKIWFGGRHDEKIKGQKGKFVFVDILEVYKKGEL